MKKLMFIICLSLGLGLMSSPSYAKKGGWSSAPAVNISAVRLAGITSNGSFVYCHYQVYNTKTGAILNTYQNSYIRALFSGCPAR